MQKADYITGKMTEIIYRHFDPLQLTSIVATCNTTEHISLRWQTHHNSGLQWRPHSSTRSFLSSVQTNNDEILQLTYVKQKICFQCTEPILSELTKTWKFDSTLEETVIAATWCHGGTRQRTSDNGTAATETTPAASDWWRWSYWRKICMYFDVRQVCLHDNITTFNWLQCRK